MKTIKLYKACLKDFDTVYNFICLLENTAFNKICFRKIYKTNIKNTDIYYLIARIDNEDAGFASMHIQHLLHHCGLIAEIQEIIVKPEFHNMKVGSKMVNRLNRIAEERNCLSFEVACNLKRKKAHNFYIKKGMKKTHYKFTLNL